MSKHHIDFEGERDNLVRLWRHLADRIEVTGLRPLDDGTIQIRGRASTDFTGLGTGMIMVHQRNLLADGTLANLYIERFEDTVVAVTIHANDDTDQYEVTGRAIRCLAGHHTEAAFVACLRSAFEKAQKAAARLVPIHGSQHRLQVAHPCGASAEHRAPASSLDARLAVSA